MSPIDFNPDATATPAPNYDGRGIGHVQHAVLDCLHAADKPLSVLIISEVEGPTEGAVDKATQALERRGLIRMDHVAERRGRARGARMWAITDAGREALAVLTSQGRVPTVQAYKARS